MATTKIILLVAIGLLAVIALSRFVYAMIRHEFAYIHSRRGRVLIVCSFLILLAAGSLTVFDKLPYRLGGIALFVFGLWFHNHVYRKYSGRN